MIEVDFELVVDFEPVVDFEAADGLALVVELERLVISQPEHAVVLFCHPED